MLARDGSCRFRRDFDASIYKRRIAERFPARAFPDEIC